MNKMAITFSDVTKTFYSQRERTFKDLIPSILGGSKTSYSDTVLDNVSFEIPAGQTVGIVGKNGAGKSTILKLIAGVSYPNEGSVAVNAKVVPLIELGAGFHHELSGYENIFLNGAILGLHKKEIEKVTDEIISFSELEEHIHLPVKHYSTGMYMRLAFSVAIMIDAPILLIDEVLAVGDVSFQNKCLSRLQELKKQQDKTIIFVSHDEEAVTDFCDRALYLSQGKILRDGTPKEVFSLYNAS